VSQWGAARIEELLYLHPGNPDLEADVHVDLSSVSEAVLEIYSQSRSPITFQPQDIVSPEFRRTSKKSKAPVSIRRSSADEHEHIDWGSNNWVIGGGKTFSGHPFLANDPHRSQQVPSLRYWVHLVSPGWNVIGGGEPALPGVSIGHNEYGAWGLTIFAIDQEDLYVYETNPENASQYRYGEKWEDMTVIHELIPVRNRSPVAVELKFTRHGPVLHHDKVNNIAYALRAAWLEVGCAPYLASLRMDQAKTWEEFRDACSFSRTPSENMVWADSKNNIGWQAVGIAPIRKKWTGLLPVPGDGRFEWEGYIPIKSLPHILNPEEGFFATANQDNIPMGYQHTLGYLWTDPFRFARIQEILGSNRKFTLNDMTALQLDELSLPARALVPFLRGIRSKDQSVEEARQALLAWDLVMDIDSIEAAIYMEWEKKLSQNTWSRLAPDGRDELLPRKSLKKMIDYLTAPDGRIGQNPTEARDKLVIGSLEEAVQSLAERLGPDMANWKYGQEKYHHIFIRHIMSRAVSDELRSKFDIGPVPRGGNGYTVNMTTDNLNQTSGASFRLIADLENWDHSLGSNCPGQSGDPDSPHYDDLIDLWAKGRYFPVLYSRTKIESAAEKTTRLIPKN